VVTICTTSLTFTNPTFCPHSVFMCSVWISEQTAIISSYNTDWFFITEMESVYCAVRTGYLNVIHINNGLQSVKGQHVLVPPLHLICRNDSTEQNQELLYLNGSSPSANVWYDIGTIVSTSNVQPARFYQTLCTYTAKTFRILEDQCLLMLCCNIKPHVFQKKNSLFPSEIYEN